MHSIGGVPVCVSVNVSPGGVEQPRDVAHEGGGMRGHKRKSALCLRQLLQQGGLWKARQSAHFFQSKTARTGATDESYVTHRTYHSTNDLLVEMALRLQPLATQSSSPKVPQVIVSGDNCTWH